MLYSQEESTSDYANKTLNLTARMEAMVTRKREYLMFHHYTNALKEFSANATQLLGQMRKNYTWILPEDFEPIETGLKSLAAWTHNKTLERSEAPPTSDPVLTAEMIEEKFFGLKMMFYKIFSAVKYGPRPKRKKDITYRKSMKRIVDEWTMCMADDPLSLPLIREDTNKTINREEQFKKTDL